MSQCEEILTRAAAEGECDAAEWASIFTEVLSRIEHNVYNVFPAPKIRPPPNAPPISSSDAIPDSTAQTNSSNPPPPSSPPQPAPLASQQDQPPPSVSPPAKTIPPPLLATYDFITSSLCENFSQEPPHTIQRLAELVLNPTDHHKFLFSYLNALDRVVCVSSALSIFPLPENDRPNGVSTSGPLVNGTNVNGRSTDSFGGDDTLGGALLTPIPWLRNGGGSVGSDRDHASPSPVMSPLSARSISSPGADESYHLSPSEQISPAREAGAVTQGELLRAEQQNSAPPAAVTSLSGAATTGRSSSPGLDDEEVPHARGPEEIGMEDTGPQDAHGKDGHLDLEAAVGRKHHNHGHDGADEKQDEVMTDAKDDNDEVNRLDEELSS